ncbi:hypothetical protein KOW79_004721 [Hemibagrus wyckioides]|uniref:Uncharacterized protein n=1 Tax=Hemibagrus wyckioides TaxID=337641 RepID=A0A9D3P1E9_9TELE|nr:hypothetical protein KOW79_004721 [Hemibagrus wyckioides]
MSIKEHSDKTVLDITAGLQMGSIVEEEEVQHLHEGVWGGDHEGKRQKGTTLDSLQKKKNWIKCLVYRHPTSNKLNRFNLREKSTTDLLI